MVMNAVEGGVNIKSANTNHRPNLREQQVDNNDNKLRIVGGADESNTHNCHAS